MRNGKEAMSWRGETPAEDDAKGCYTEGIVSRVVAPSTEGGSWEIGYGDGWICGMPQGDVEPKVGDTFRVYGRFGNRFHGQALNGIVLWYSTPAEMEVKHNAMVAKMDADRRERFERERERLDRDYESLPGVLRKRIDRFRAANPDFRWEYENYEMFVCTQAAVLGAWVAQQPDPIMAIDAWSKQAFAEKTATVPAWSDAHSGNTEGCAIALAWSLIDSPERVVMIPGAMTPLVGTVDYSKKEN